jgi:hypothetical protein
VCKGCTLQSTFLCVFARLVPLAAAPALSNDHFDSYVLSESSLFVYPRNVVLKTCGRSTPFLCLRKLVQYTTVRVYVYVFVYVYAYVYVHVCVFCLCREGLFPPLTVYRHHFVFSGPCAGGPLCVSACYPQELGCEVEWLAYTRKNFTFPSAQLFPHSSAVEEVRKRLCPPSRTEGGIHVAASVG